MYAILPLGYRHAILLEINKHHEEKNYKAKLIFYVFRRKIISKSYLKEKVTLRTYQDATLPWYTISYLVSFILFRNIYFDKEAKILL